MSLLNLRIYMDNVYMLFYQTPNSLLLDWDTCVYYLYILTETRTVP